MVALGKQLGHGVLFMLGASLLSTVALAEPAGAPIDPYAAPAAAPPPAPPPPAPPPPVVVPAPTSPPPSTPSQSASGGSSNSSNNNTNNIQANPTNNNTNTANQTNTSTNTNTNDNRSTATATNNNTIYIYPPAYPPPAPPPVIAPPGPLGPPPLVPPPPMLGRSPYGPPPVLSGRRIRLNCAQLCGQPPPLVRPPMFTTIRERFRPVAIGAHFTALGMAKQPLAGWGTLYGGGFHMTFRSRGHFGFEFAQDFLKGELRAHDHGPTITRSSFPVDFTFRGYILPNLDRHHVNFYLGGGFGAMASSLEAPGPYGTAQQSFLEWTLHVDAGAELRFNWFALGADAKVLAIVRDGNFGDAVYYGGVDNGVVPDKTWGVQGRGYLSFWF